MSKYIALQRFPRKHYLSRHTKILLSSLLVPIALLALATAPVGAAPRHNPVFATLQDMHNAISKALAPIKSTIRSLQTQQQNQANQIAALQNSNTSSKSLQAYDANGQDLGLLVDHSADAQTIFVPSIQKFLFLLPGNPGLQVYDAGLAYYQSSDCSGAPYTDGTDTTSLQSNLFTTNGQQYYTVSNLTSSSMSFNSWSSTDDNGNYQCVAQANTINDAYSLQQVTLPFTTPIAFPLQFKYQ